jgi:starch synthase
MELDFSWARSGVEYLQLYQEAMSAHLDLQKTARC